MASDVETALEGVQAHEEEFKAEHEGFRDYERVTGNSPDAHAVTLDRIRFYDERKALCDNFEAAAQALIAHGYPELPVVEVSPEALAAFQSNSTTIQAALTKVASNAAVTVSPKAGATERK